MTKYILPLLFLIAVYAIGCKAKQKQLYITTLSVEDSVATDGQMDTAVMVLKKRLEAEKITFSAVAADHKAREISITSEALDKDWIKASLLKRGDLVLYEAYSITELVGILKDADEWIAGKINQPGKEKVANPLFSILNPAQPYGYDQSVPGFIGMVSKKDMPLLKQYIEMTKDILPADTKMLWVEQTSDKTKAKYEEVYFVKDNDTKLSLSNHVEEAFMDIPDDKHPAVQIKLDTYGAYMFKRITGKNVNKTLPIVIDNRILSAPKVLSEIVGGRLVLNGNFEKQEAQDIANTLQSGYLPLQLQFKNMQQMKPHDK